MKNLILFISLSLVTACNQQNKSQITDLLHLKIDAWHEAASKAKFDDYFNFIADEGIFIGTDASERWSKAEFINFSKPYFDKGKAWSFTSKERTIRLNHDNKIAWFDEILDTWMGPCRSSGVLRKNKDDWQLEHYQLSITIDNELMPKFLEINNIK